MNNWHLPIDVHHVSAPPLKCQGIKTKLVRFIASNIQWSPSERGRWIEPFAGTAVVALNLAPPRALVSDVNPHIVRLLQDIQSGSLNPLSARDYLTAEGARLSQSGESHYYRIRERFNSSPSSLDFLFLNRASFNGVVRFNKKGQFNTPFGHKPERFDKAFLTRVCNQIGWAATQMRGKDWKITCADWRETLAQCAPGDFVYLDPPYIGRNADYFSQWNDREAADLAAQTQSLECGYALSMWLENRYRKNSHIADEWGGNTLRLASHFYHVGASESLRNEMTEALVIRPGFEAPDSGVFETKKARRAATNDLFSPQQTNDCQ